MRFVKYLNVVELYYAVKRMVLWAKDHPFKFVFRAAAVYAAMVVACGVVFWIVASIQVAHPLTMTEFNEQAAAFQRYLDSLPF
jgi:hypothetical protein